MKEPKVLVGCPTAEYKAYCLEEYARAVKALSYGNYNVLLVDNSETKEYSEKIKQLGLPVEKDEHLERARERITQSRNIIRKKVLDEGYDYFLSLEQDVIPPKDIIEQLLKQDKKVITGVYFTKYKLDGKTVLRPLLWQKGKENKLTFVADEEVGKSQVLQIKASGLGCMLIHRSILEKISFRLVEGSKAYDDMAFCQDLDTQNIPLYVDMDVKCKHLIEGMDWDKIKE